MQETSPIQKLNHKDPEISEKMKTVFHRSYQIEADLIGIEDFPPLHRTAKDLQESKTLFLGYWKNDSLAAVIELEENKSELSINSLVVDPEYFRQGIATKMIDYVLDLFVPTVAVVETALVNTPAISLYEKKGFVKQKTWMTTHGIEKIQLLRS